jgi:predicted acyltransferase
MNLKKNDKRAFNFLDVFRGFTILFVTIVNKQEGSWAAIYRL